MMVVGEKVEKHGERLVFSRSSGELTVLFLLEIMGRWSEVAAWPIADVMLAKPPGFGISCLRRNMAVLITWRG
jgi:hypothetical protein